MRITIDIETQGLNSRKFLIGVLMYENYTYEVFKHPEPMLERIYALGQKQHAKGECLYVYAHKMEYEYVGIGAFERADNVVFCDHPLIVDTYGENDRGELTSYIKWIDTLGLWRGSLETLGEAIGEPKTPMPAWLKLDSYEPSFQEFATMTEYCIQDCKVLMTFIRQLRGKLWKEGIRPKRLITIGQVAIQYFMRTLREKEYALHGGHIPSHYDPQKGYYIKKGIYLEDVDGCAFYDTQYSAEVLESYRLGRVQAFHTGHHPSVHLDDINSLFPYASMHIPYPQLNTERKIVDPLRLYTKDQLFTQIGVSRCTIRTPQEQILGYLAVRQYKGTETETSFNEYTHYPETLDGEQHTLVGTWTHLELSRALTLGYELVSVEWSVVWEEIANPFTELIPKLYDLRRASGTEFDNTFYKLMMNNIFGKLAQRRPHKQLLKVDREELPAYQSDGWDALYEWGTDVLISKGFGIEKKRFYAPIIASYVTAWSRDYLYSHMQQIPRDQLWYCATDSIVYDSIYSSSNTFKYGENLGEWKREHSGEELLVYGRASYCIGDQVKLSRVPKTYVTKKDFYNGYIAYRDLIPLKRTKDKNLIGTPVERERELDFETPIELSPLLIDTRIALDADTLTSLLTLYD